uniref:Protein kinase domain-containing protein n=1 Tax=viral metagenome TaxID=1070528 RepID=A0A6C0E6W1_9ZZZZ
MKGGKLCDSYKDQSGEDIYELGQPLFPNVYLDKNNPNLLIKIINDKNEYLLSKLLENNGFVPKVYGYFHCKQYIKVPKYTVAQQRIKAYNSFNPNSKKDLGEIAYTEVEKPVQYMVMERIHGNSLISSSPETNSSNVKTYIDEIYRLYNVLADKGFVLNDLAARNIILSNNGKIYFIDFDPVYAENTMKAIPLSKRLSKETLLSNLLKEINTINSYGGRKRRRTRNRRRNIKKTMKRKRTHK